MKKAIAAACLSLTLMGQASPPKKSADVQLWRLDCGSVQVNQLNAFSDTDAYPGQSRELTASCYLIRHGADYMLWDTGLPEALLGKTPNKTDAMSPTLRRTIVSELAEIGVKPEQIGRIGISHYHFDHIGQAASFPKATLLIGKGDLDALKAHAPGTDAAPLAPWIEGGAPSEPVTGDKDVFGDGTVTMIDLPGHTPGHHGLIVKLRHTGDVFLSGDVAHFAENLDSNGVPPFNTERADSLASMDRYRKLGAAHHALMIIQHDPRDIPKLPAFPKAAH